MIDEKHIRRDIKQFEEYVTAAEEEKAELRRQLARLALFEKYDRTLKALRRVEEQTKTTRAELAVDCQHERVADYGWVHSNGIGTHTQKVGARCLLCEFIDFYKDGRWADPKHIRNQWDD